MSHATHLQSEEQYLGLIESGITTIKAPQEESNEAAANEFFENPLFKQISSFYYHNRLRLSLTLSEQHKYDFVLIKGLIEFHRPRNLNFFYDRKNSSFETDIYEHETTELRSFLGNVAEWLKKEKQFKLALKMILDLERRYRLERDSVYQVMRNAITATS